MYPRILHIYGPLWINSYGVMIAIGFSLFMYLTYTNPKREKIISSDTFFNTIFIGLISGIIGGRIFFLISEWQVFSQNIIEIFYPWVGGFAILGTIIGVITTVPIYLKIKGVKILPTLDLVAVYAPLMQSISRIGCFLAGCCYGIPAAKNLIWAITFKNTECLAPTNIALHPTQLYLAAASFCIFLILYIKEKYFSNKIGQLTFFYLMLESVSRFTIDFWRGDRDLIENSYAMQNLSYTQLFALTVFISGLIGYIWVSKKQNLNLHQKK